MALRTRSLFLYGYTVTQYNGAIDFRRGATTYRATVPTGYYSLTSLCAAISRAMVTVDSDIEYTCSALRLVVENRVVFSADVSFTLLFGTGARVSSSIASLIGFNAVDSGPSMSHYGSFTTGTKYMPDRVAYNYRGPSELVKQDGARVVSASGIKETIVFATQRFVEAHFKYNRDKASLERFLEWATLQKRFEITPEFDNPTVFFEVTLDKTANDQNGMAFELVEHVGDGMPNYWDTGMLRMRVAK
jgi:hypothetical protein